MVRISLVLATIVALCFGSRTASAAGSASLKSHEATEVSGAWHIFVKLELPRPPSIPHVPMRFMFTKVAVYERALIDGHSEPVENRQVLQNQPPTQESLDVDFANSSGKIFKGTNFDFGLTRDRGYEAGEYILQIRTSDGVDIGGKMNLTLKGDNPVVDRRSMTFEAKGKVKKVDNGVDAGPKKTDDDTAAAAPQNGEVEPSGQSQPFIPPSAYDKTDEEQIKEKPKGCGCSVPGLSSETSALVGLAPLFGLALAARRRRSKKG